MIRSKARWHDEGEKSTKYFLNLEKRHFNTKTIRQLQLENSSVIKTDEEILTEAKSFYQNLYASRAPDISAHGAFFLLRRIYCKTRSTRAGRMLRTLNKRGMPKQSKNYGIGQNSRD